MLQEPPPQEDVLSLASDIDDRVRCWKRNKQVSVCPNMKTGNFIRLSELEKYYFDKRKAS